MRRARIRRSSCGDGAAPGAGRHPRAPDHYTPNGKPTTDRTVGLIFSKDPSPREVRTSAFFDAPLQLPAGSPDTSCPARSRPSGTIVYGLFPHTHLRGKAWAQARPARRHLEGHPVGAALRLQLADLLPVQGPLRVPRGEILSTAWYDNSPGNKDNPNSKVDVKWAVGRRRECGPTGLLFRPGHTAGAGHRDAAGGGQR